MPGFDETNEADLAVTLAELFAYTGDQLSYMQDAVATERYLHTARQRWSIRRHARLVDFRMHDGMAARTFLGFEVDREVLGSVTVPAGTAVATVADDPAEAVVFETEEEIRADFARNRMIPHTWGNVRCCLPAGSLAIDLKGKQTTLAEGQPLLIEEVLGPTSAGLAAAAADRHRREVVTITRLEALTDPLEPDGQRDVTRVRWGEADALRFDYCLEGPSPDTPATVARGNLARQPRRDRAPGNGPPPVADPATRPDDLAAALGLLRPGRGDEHRRPQGGRRRLDRARDPAGLRPQRHRLRRRGRQRRAGSAHVRRRGLGREPADDAVLRATYRVGNGAAGNVGADTLTRGARSRPASCRSATRCRRPAGPTRRRSTRSGATPPRPSAAAGTTP